MRGCALDRGRAGLAHTLLADAEGRGATRGFRKIDAHVLASPSLALFAKATFAEEGGCVANSACTNGR
jgi:hypothetical protein